MQHPWSSNVSLRKRAIASAFAVAFSPFQVWAGAYATPSPDTPPAVTAQDTDGAAASKSSPRVYSVINLGPEAGAAALLNERGQAAFGSISNSGTSNGFFDGERVHKIGSLGGSYTMLRGLNNYGVVVGESQDNKLHSNILAFAWTVGGGMRALAGTSVSSARAINDRNHIVGFTGSPGISGRAIRWNPDGTVTALGPLPPSLSEAFDVNQGGVSTGFTDVASGAIHATLWNRAGILTDLGNLGGDRAFGMHINDFNAVAGQSDNAANDRELGFFWSRSSGMVPIDVEGGGVRLVSGLNNRGEVVGDTHIDGRSVAYQWSLGRGVVVLPSGSATRSDVFDINNHGEMVGLIERPAADGGGVRAVRWPALTRPIDLNTRLHRPPAGLVLEAGAAINDDGVILAHSNAGLVMLRPGTHGTDAPVLGPMVGFPDVIEVGQDLSLTVGFVDHKDAQPHTASATWSDGCASPAPTVSEARGVGEVRLQHQFCAAGYYTVKTQVTDSAGLSTELQQDIVVEAPALASVSGKGTLSNRAAWAGRRGPSLPLRFALWSPLGGGSGDKGSVGSPVVMFSGPFHFLSDAVTTATGSGQQAHIEGTGRLNGRPGYRFMLEAYAGGGKQGASPDRLRVQVTHMDALTGVEMVDYDNGAPAMARSAVAPDHTVVLEGGLMLRN